MLNQICLPIRDEARETIQHLLNGTRSEVNADTTMAAHRLVCGRWSSDLRPKPFHVKSVGGAGGSGMILLGYTPLTLDDLRSCAVQNEAWGLDPIDWERSKLREIPVMDAGTKLSFRLTCIPSERVRLPPRNGEITQGTKVCEVDAFICARHRLGKDVANPTDAYRAWVQKHFAGDLVKDDFLDETFAGASSAEINEFEIETAMESGLMRPLYETGNKRTGKFTWDKRKRAKFAGIVTVKDGERFRAVLARGFGRHRAYGMGMMLLARG